MRNYMRPISVWLAIVLVILVGAATQQANDQKKGQERKPSSGQKQNQTEESGEVLKVGSELVTVPFTVTDKKNKYIT